MNPTDIIACKDLPDTITLSGTLTQEHLDHGRRCSCTHCPLSLLLSEKLREQFPHVAGIIHTGPIFIALFPAGLTGNVTDYYTHFMQTTGPLRDFMENFDTLGGKRPEPGLEVHVVLQRRKDR